MPSNRENPGSITPRNAMGTLDKECRTAGLALPNKGYYADGHSKKPPKLASIRHGESACLHMISRYPPAAALS